MAAFDRFRKVRDGYSVFIDQPANNTTYDFVLPGYLLSDGAGVTSTGGAKVRPAVVVQRITFSLLASAGTTAGDVVIVLQSTNNEPVFQLFEFQAQAAAANITFPRNYLLSDSEKGGVVLTDGTPQFKWTGGFIAGGWTVRSVSIDYQVFDSSIISE